ncbi:MAG: hypothetical protein GY853_16410 [PVC group bacterium]|nr:hypothetical protein [PVC group bacterium]
MTENDIIDQLIEALTNNQELLDSKNKIKVQNLRDLISDLNYSFLEIMKSIRDGRNSKDLEENELGKKVSSMFA